jgi:hypothetical protein
MAGVSPLDLAEAHAVYGSIPFLTPGVATVAGTTEYYVWDKGPGCPFYRGCTVIALRGLMTGAGGGGMTVRLYRVRDGTAVAITDAISVAALSDGAPFTEGTIDDAYMTLLRGDNLKIVTVNDPLTLVTVECAKNL